MFDNKNRLHVVVSLQSTSARLAVERHTGFNKQEYTGWKFCQEYSYIYMQKIYHWIVWVSASTIQITHHFSVNFPLKYMPHQPGLHPPRHLQQAHVSSVYMILHKQVCVCVFWKKKKKNIWLLVLCYSVLSCFLRSQQPLWVPVRVLGALLPVQHPADMSEKVTEDSLTV